MKIDPMDRMAATMQVETPDPGEKDSSDAPSYMDADRASGWADGWNACRREMGFE